MVKTNNYQFILYCWLEVAAIMVAVAVAGSSNGETTVVAVAVVEYVVRAVNSHLYLLM